MAQRHELKAIQTALVSRMDSWLLFWPFNGNLLGGKNKIK